MFLSNNCISSSLLLKASSTYRLSSINLASDCYSSLIFYSLLSTYDFTPSSKISHLFSIAYLTSFVDRTVFSSIPAIFYLLFLSIVSSHFIIQTKRIEKSYEKGLLVTSRSINLIVFAISKAWESKFSLS